MWAVNRAEILKATKVIFRPPNKLSGLAPEAVVSMLYGQNPALKVRDWKILPAQKDQKGLLMDILVDDYTGGHSNFRT